MNLLDGLETAEEGVYNSGQIEDGAGSFGDRSGNAVSAAYVMQNHCFKIG